MGRLIFSFLTVGLARTVSRPWRRGGEQTGMSSVPDLLGQVAHDREADAAIGQGVGASLARYGLGDGAGA